MTDCFTCGSELPPDGENCPACDTDGEVYRCRRCGEDFAGADACPFCGGGRVEMDCAAHVGTQAEGRCVVCGLELCRVCARGEGRAFRCESHGDIPVIQGWAQVYSTTREIEARLLRDNLEAEGLHARIFSQKDNMLSVDLGELSIVRLLVPAWEYEAAHELIVDHMDDDGEVGFACPACGEPHEVGSDRCAACGAPIGTRA